MACLQTLVRIRIIAKEEPLKPAVLLNSFIWILSVCSLHEAVHA